MNRMWLIWMKRRFWLSSNWGLNGRVISGSYLFYNSDKELTSSFSNPKSVEKVKECLKDQGYFPMDASMLTPVGQIIQALEQGDKNSAVDRAIANNMMIDAMIIAKASDPAKYAEVVTALCMSGQTAPPVSHSNDKASDLLALKFMISLFGTVPLEQCMSCLYGC